MTKENKKRKETVTIYPDTFERLARYAKENGVTIKFFTTKAVDEKLDREMVKKLK